MDSHKHSSRISYVFLQPHHADSKADIKDAAMAWLPLTCLVITSTYSIMCGLPCIAGYSHSARSGLFAQGSLGTGLDQSIVNFDGKAVLVLTYAYIISQNHTTSTAADTDTVTNKKRSDYTKLYFIFLPPLTIFFSYLVCCFIPDLVQ